MRESIACGTEASAPEGSDSTALENGMETARACTCAAARSPEREKTLQEMHTELSFNRVSKFLLVLTCH